jgi:hypothetical protein
MPAAFLLTILKPITGRRRLLLVIRRLLVWLLAIYFSSVAIQLLTGVLALLAGSGVSFAVLYSATYLDFLLAQLLLAAIIWLLIGVPHQAHEMGLDKDSAGEVQRSLVGALTVVACACTAIYIWLLRYSLLENIHDGPLFVGTVFTIALLPRYYSSLARACWQRGISGIFSTAPLVSRWDRVKEEVHKARHADDGGRADAAERLGWLDRTLRAIYTYERPSGPLTEDASEAH